MEQSPLTHQPRPEVFQPKIVQLYEELFGDDQDAPIVTSEGFWTEFFLLKPDRAALRAIIEDLPPAELLALESQTRALFARAVTIAASGVDTGRGHEKTIGRNGSANGLSPTSPTGRASPKSAPARPLSPARAEKAAAAALDTLSVFLSSVLDKKYTNPSSDVIAVLAGLDRVDAVMTEFVAALDGLLRHGRSLALRTKAVEVTLAVTAGAYQTTLLTYFIQRDLFPSIIRLIIDSDSPRAVFDPFMLIGLLANYNKFEFQNPYQLRLNDFVNEAAIQTILRSIGDGCRRLRGQYIDVQEDLPEGWTLASTLGLIGLGGIASGAKQAAKPVYDAETAKQMFAELPGPEAAILLATYDFTHANKLFCFNLVTLPGQPATKKVTAGSNSNSTAGGEAEEQPFASFISLASYLLQHAFQSHRTTLYTHLSLMVFRLLIEDPVLCKRMCSDESKTPVRLCRQRAPHLPLPKPAARPLAASILDVMVDGITHNLRRRLDVGLYTLCVGILLRLVAHLSRTRTRLAYHWSELFRAMMGLIKFLTTYAADLQGTHHTTGHLETLVDHVVNLVALGLSAGEAFLPTPASYDDLFYKVVEAGETLTKFRDTYKLSSRPTNSIDTLISVSEHYHQMLADGVAKGGKGGRVKGSAAGGSSSLTSLQVAEVIKQGYETLSIQATEGLDSWEKYREADERTLLKRVARAAVADVKFLVGDDE